MKLNKKKKAILHNKVEIINLTINKNKILLILQEMKKTKKIKDNLTKVLFLLVTELTDILVFQ
jgi:hypothetical protein